MRFIDKVRIYAQAGRGGSGCLSFLREKYREFGGPDGADGGKGGDIVLRADRQVGTLLELSYRPHLKAPIGGDGKGRNKTGATAADLVVRVPVGTMVFKAGGLIADLSSEGATVRAAAGGRGGRGNASFKSRSNTAPRNYEKGEPGEEAELELELKLIADVGLAGFPNAGKSTLLARLSNARPKVADYPFTTLAPHLGIVQHKEKSFVMADIPGLIEGAHAGKGLGDDFLRHVERTRVLVIMIDPMGFEGTDPAAGVRKLEEELRRYSKALAAKPRLLAVNKMDLPAGEAVLKKVRGRYRKRKVFGVSGVSGRGLEALLDSILAELARHHKALINFEPRRVRVARGSRKGKETDVRRVKMEKGFQIERCEPGCFQVTGRFVERVASMTDMSLLESVYRLQTTFRRIGVDRALRSAGIREGELVSVGPLEFEWSDKPLVRPPKLSKRGRR